MKFRPCIDLHSGKVKQIVGSSIQDKLSNKSNVETNFETDRSSSSYAEMYKNDKLTGGHVIMLGEGNIEAAKSSLASYPQGLQVGGGINTSNAKDWLEFGASHVIVTSYVFHNGKIDMKCLSALVGITGKDRLVLDLSCRKKYDNPSGPYYVVTDRWQTFTDIEVNKVTLELLSQYCDEFLVHGVENEGKRCGILEDLVVLLGEFSPIPVTYAGGANHISDLDRVKELGKGKVDLTIGSALDCFGGNISYRDVVEWHNKENNNIN